jgi:hypothetical protein
MALNFSPVATPLRNLEIWHADNSEYAFAISRVSQSGTDSDGSPEYVASWRSLLHNKPTDTVGGSPFATFAEAEEACEFFLMHLDVMKSEVLDPSYMPLKTMPAWTRDWHVWRVVVPRRSITGRLLRGEVLRRHDGRSWIYKKLGQAGARNE